METGAVATVINKKDPLFGSLVRVLGKSDMPGHVVVKLISSLTPETFPNGEDHLMLEGDLVEDEGVTVALSMYEVLDSDSTGIDLVLVQSGKPIRFFSNYTIDSDDERNEDGDVDGFYLNNHFVQRVTVDKAMFLVSLMKLKEVSKNEIV